MTKKTLHGWRPAAEDFCYGLPGGLFDPLGFSTAQPLGTVRRYREAEIMHGRVAMVAFVGYLAGEAGAPAVWNGAVGGNANDQLLTMPGANAAVLVLSVGVAEAYRAQRGWVSPDSSEAVMEMRDSYYPGDLGFDPLKLAPADGPSFADMAGRELDVGRMAMIAVAGLAAQESQTHETVAATLGRLLDA